MMERLTFLNGDEIPCVRNDQCFEEQSEHYCGPAIDRLAAYEDTHMMPPDVMSMRMDMAILTAGPRWMKACRRMVLTDGYRSGQMQGLCLSFAEHLRHADLGLRLPDSDGKAPRLQQ